VVGRPGLEPGTYGLKDDETGIRAEYIQPRNASEGEAMAAEAHVTAADAGGGPERSERLPERCGSERVQSARIVTRMAFGYLDRDEPEHARALLLAAAALLAT
jgi:hypothetical protein